MKRFGMGAAGVVFALVTLVLLWVSFTPDTDIPADFVYRDQRMSGPMASGAEPGGPGADVPGSEPVSSVDRLRRDLRAHPLPDGEATVRIRVVSLDIEGTGATEDFPADWAPGESRDGIRRPHPDDPPHEPLTEEAFLEWRDELLDALSEVVFACGAGRHDVMCDGHACATRMVDGAYDQRVGFLRRPAQIPEKIGRWLGLPAVVDTCGQARERYHRVSGRDARVHGLPTGGCFWDAPQPAFEHHENRLGAQHGEALCEVLSASH